MPATEPISPASAAPTSVPRWLFWVFFFSGFSALVYQVVWQRSLFAIYGINVESVSVVVTAFMLGLGLGSFLGGELSRNPRRRVLLTFAVVELGIGAWGFLSLPILRGVGALTLSLSPAATAACTFALVLLPTLLMGATLPLLVAHLTRLSGNVGRSVGSLYFINTLGSACASFAAVLLLLRFMGQTGAVHAAAGLNVCVGVFVLMRRGAAEAVA